MTTSTHKLDLIDRAIALNRELGVALADMIGMTDAIRTSLSTPVEAPLQPALNAPQTREEVFAAHRRAHRSGRPGKIEGDPELEAFILARIAVQTYAEIIADVKERFPADRQTSISAVQRWWCKRHSAGKAT